MDLTQLQAIAPYITAGGDVFSLQVLGYFEEAGPICRVEAVIDASQNPPQVIFQRELTDLGQGYPRSMFSTAAGAQ